MPREPPEIVPTALRADGVVMGGEDVRFRALCSAPVRATPVAGRQVLPIREQSKGSRSPCLALLRWTGGGVVLTRETGPFATSATTDRSISPFLLHHTANGIDRRHQCVPESDITRPLRTAPAHPGPTAIPAATK
ncbi:hypothetical protein Pme01_36440 [Planosporangium mesophilum]|uniref:Uncharacterized protein n=1 Tax=Planosporangium mesophilum TaxID=689768 RepID=A0A8J3TDX2_9ACTN|nr:hypothetical protein Pme01_36440 [Planosporangium mesophilum]